LPYAVSESTSLLSELAKLLCIRCVSLPNVVVASTTCEPSSFNAARVRKDCARFDLRTKQQAVSLSRLDLRLTRVVELPRLTYNGDTTSVFIFTASNLSRNTSTTPALAIGPVVLKSHLLRHLGGLLVGLRSALIGLDAPVLDCQLNLLDVVVPRRIIHPPSVQLALHANLHEKLLDTRTALEGPGHGRGARGKTWSRGQPWAWR
jgi:hypothetical protein